MREYGVLPSRLYSSARITGTYQISTFYFMYDQRVNVVRSSFCPPCLLHTKMVQAVELRTVGGVGGDDTRAQRELGRSAA